MTRESSMGYGAGTVAARVNGYQLDHVAFDQKINVMIAPWISEGRYPADLPEGSRRTRGSREARAGLRRSTDRSFQSARVRDWRRCLIVRHFLDRLHLTVRLIAGA
jgi:hypothetical protein